MQYLEQFYQENYLKLLDWSCPLRPSKSCPKNGAAGVAKFVDFYKKTQALSFTEDEVLKRFCLTCFYEETKTGESSGHNLEDVSSKNATCLVDGVKSHKHCTICNKNFDANGNAVTGQVRGKDLTLVTELYNGLVIYSYKVPKPSRLK